MVFFSFFFQTLHRLWIFSIIDEYLTGVYEARFRIIEEKGEGTKDREGRFRSIRLSVHPS